MKKILCLLFTVMIICSLSISAVASESTYAKDTALTEHTESNNGNTTLIDTKIVGGKISLTQFIGTYRENVKSAQLYIKGQIYAIDKDAFYDIADTMTITSNIEPYTISNDGIYICITDTMDVSQMIYLHADGIDRATPAPGRPLYALYTVDNVSLIEKITALAGQQNNIKYSDWAAAEIAKANELNIIPEDFLPADYTQPITRENFCILATKMIESKLGQELDIVNPQYPLAIVDVDNVNIDKLYAAGIIKGKEQKKTGVIFAPNDLITREEAATILDRVTEYMGIVIPQISNQQILSDEDLISDWALIAVKTMQEMKIMNGVGENVFAPKDTYTIEQTIATLVRVYEYE